MAGDTLFHAGRETATMAVIPTCFSRPSATISGASQKTCCCCQGTIIALEWLAVDREPGNPSIVRRLNEAESGPVGPTTLEDEHNSNPFFRLDQPGVISTLQSSFPERDLSSQRSRFLAMRELRNRW